MYSSTCPPDSLLLLAASVTAQRTSDRAPDPAASISIKKAARISKASDGCRAPRPAVHGRQRQTFNNHLSQVTIGVVTVL
eukprot:8972232-Heterocapsa_arctica.AAC.1